MLTGPIVSMRVVCGRRGLLLLLAVLLLQACVFVPRTVEVYDTGCQIKSKQMYVEPVVIGDFLDCSDETCARYLVALGAVAATSVVVSGSIVIVGNAVYWFEKQGRCVREL